MVVTIVGNSVYVRLSRRNLRQLEAIFDSRDVRHRCLARKDESGVSLVVQVEDDAHHYQRDRSGPRLGEVAHQPQAANHA